MKERRFVQAETGPLPDPPPDGRPIGEIFKDIVNNVSEIVRTEIRLVSVEVKQEVAELKVAAIAILIGNVLLIYAGIFMLLGLVYALSTMWPPWASALVVGAGVGVIGAIILTVGIGKFKRPKAK